MNVADDDDDDDDGRRFIHVIKSASVDLCTCTSMMNGSTKYLKGLVVIEERLHDE